MYDELINKLRIGAKCFPGYELYGYSKEPFRLMPEHLTQAADAIEELSKERKTGKWELEKVRGDLRTVCSCCERETGTLYEFNFCPNCGAEMESADDRLV